LWLLYDVLRSGGVIALTMDGFMIRCWSSSPPSPNGKKQSHTCLLRAIAQYINRWSKFIQIKLVLLLLLLLVLVIVVRRW
jgi:hypothetical protein